jgi:putative transposase
MNSIRTYKFRLYPDFKRQSIIEMQLVLSKNFYNKLLEKAKARYEKDKKFSVSLSAFNTIKKEVILENRDFLQLYSQTRCEIENRVIKAYQNFFRRVKQRKSGKKIAVGFPRFKSKNKYYSIVYPQDNGSFSTEKERKTEMLRVSRIGRMKIDIHRQIEGRIKTMTIKKETGKYYAIFTAITEMEPPKVENTKPIGVDMGLHSFVAMSDGTKIVKPKFVKKKAKRISRWQRVIARRHKGSTRRERAKERLQQEWEHTTNQSNDFAHKLSKDLINSGFTSFAVEKLNINNMVKNHRLAQSIYNASWKRFIKMLSYKAESAGLKVYEVNPKDTTQECSNCGHVKEGAEKLTLEERIYHCNLCEKTMDRDVNASINILERGREGHSRTYAQGDGVRPQRAAAVEELRTYSALQSANA